MFHFSLFLICHTEFLLRKHISCLDRSSKNVSSQKPGYFIVLPTIHNQNKTKKILQIGFETFNLNIISSSNNYWDNFRSSHLRCSAKKMFSKFRKIHRKTPVPEPKICNFIKKETLAQLFGCELCKISKNTFSTEHLRTTASEIFSVAFLIKTILWTWNYIYGS